MQVITFIIIRYHWLETNETSAKIANLAAGIYTLNILDSNGCSATLIATVPPYVSMCILKRKYKMIEYPTIMRVFFKKTIVLKIIFTLKLSNFYFL